MLVYTNSLHLVGKDSSEAAFKAVGGWLKLHIGYGLHPEQLKTNGTYEGKNKDGRKGRVRIHAANNNEFNFYSWTLIHQGDDFGRQWTVEIGLKASNGDCFFSCVVKTDERSALIAKPVQASRPKVIRYLSDNIREFRDSRFAPTVIGLKVKTVEGNEHSYQGLLAEIEHHDRKRPIVLLSPLHNQESYLVNPQTLQDDLIGLAQVIKISPNSNSYEMANALSERYSAWAGAINIIYPETNGRIYNSLIKSDEISELLQTEKISHILALVTNRTNTVCLRDHIRPEGVAQLCIRHQLQDVSSQIKNASDRSNEAQLNELLNLAIQLDEQLKEAQDECLNLNIKIEEQDDEIRRKDFEMQSLKSRLSDSAKPSTNISELKKLVSIASASEEPSPFECLNIVASLYANECTVLETAFKSAKKMENFTHGWRLLKMLDTLLSDFRNELLLGGDSKARTVFTQNEYSATESESVISNKSMKKRRTFEYKGQPVEMYRHLKIGVANDTTKTIRVYFHWDANEEKIVIGHCGEHLPVASH